MRMISPTVKSWYDDNPDWTTNKTLRATRNFGTGKDVDIYGFDVNGWDESGVDRAGYTAADYAADQDLSALIARHAPRIKGARNSYSCLRKILPASDAVLSCMLESWPHAEIHDGVTATVPERDLGTIFDPGAVISRTIDSIGTIAVELNVIPASPDGGKMWARSVKIAFSHHSAYDASDPVNTVSFDVSVFETEGIETTLTDLATLEDVSYEVGRILADFDPEMRSYAICVEDGAGGCISAVALSDETAETDESACGAVSGDYLFMEAARSREEALLRVRDRGRLRTAALMEMLDRGLALEAGAAPPSFGG